MNPTIFSLHLTFLSLSPKSHMAKWSSDWSLPGLSPSKTLSKATSSSFLFSLLHSISTIPISSKKHFMRLAYSTRSTSLLEDAVNDLHTNPVASNSLCTPPAIPDLGITNEFIQSVCRNPQTEALALEYYRKAKKQQPSFRPDGKTLKLLIAYLLRSKLWSSFSTLIEDLGDFNVIPDKSTSSKMMSSFIRARKFKLAESLLGVLETKEAATAVSSYSSAMRAYNKLHMYNCAVSAYERMIMAGITPDSSCYRQIIEAYGAIGDVEKVLNLFLEFNSKHQEPPANSSAILVVLCRSLCKNSRPFEALRYFREMEEKGVSANSPMYSLLISSFAEAREAEIAKDLFREAVENGMAPKDQAMFMKLVIMYLDLDMLENTFEIVETMRKLEINVSDCVFSTIINGFIQKRGLRDAVSALEKLISLGCQPGQVTFASAINVYCRLGLLEKAESVFLLMIDKGFDKCLVAYSNIISMYGKAGKASDAMRLLAKMKEKGCKPNVWVYNSLLDMNGRLMNLRQVEKLWLEMNRRNISPDLISYTSIISAYSKSRRLDECIKFYEEFMANGGKVDMPLAGIMVGVFSKASRLDELIKLLQDLKKEGKILDRRLYESSLNALRDAGLELHVKWFRKSFSFKMDKT